MKTIFLLVIILITSFCSYAQFSFGVKGGAQLNNVHFKDFEDEITDTGPTVGLHLGVFFQIDINEKLAFIPELQLIKRGFQDDTGMQSVRLNANYLEAPLLASFAPVKMLRLEAGPTLGYNISTVIVREESRKTNNGLYKRFALGVTAGIRVLPIDKLEFMLQYHYGLTPSAKISFNDYDGAVINSGTLHNTGIQLSVAYKLFSK